MRQLFNPWRICWSVVVFAAVSFALPQLALGVAPVVKTVPVDPTDATIQHTACPGTVITLKGTSDQQGATVMYDWDFGDGSLHATGVVTNMFNVSATHTYAGPNLKSFTAILKITSTGGTASNNYLVQMVNPCTLPAKVNIAIDEGLWYLHITEQRYTSGPTLGSAGAIPVGGWEQYAGAPGCISANGGAFTCGGSGANDASNVQAYEVNKHQANGPASDPYTEDVARGTNRMLMFLNSYSPVPTKTYNFNAPPSCPAAPCVFPASTFDGNANNRYIYADGDSLGRAYYEGGQFIDALVASNNPAGIAATGNAGVMGLSHKDIVQDLVDGYGLCQYPSSPGGAWYYFCSGYVDNSVSQWAAIGLIGAARAFGITVPAIVKDANQVWLMAGHSEDAATGQFGYTSTSPIWGPFATTPSGLVQLAMDDAGRGDARWDKAESFYRDNFCNDATTSGTGEIAPRAYTYGMFSFTKAMLEHDPGGALNPITNLQSSTAGVNPIDWYGAQQSGPLSKNNCDGVAATLVNRQGMTSGSGAPVPSNGFWTNHSSGQSGAAHWSFETGWSIIMLRKTVFIACVSRPYGRGTPSGIAPARVDLTWTGINNVDHYDVLRSTVSGGSYTKVGSTTGVAFRDQNPTFPLVNGGTYYYVVQPINVGGVEICQSDEEKVVIPAGR